MWYFFWIKLICVCIIQDYIFYSSCTFLWCYDWYYITPHYEAQHWIIIFFCLFLFENLNLCGYKKMRLCVRCQFINVVVFPLLFIFIYMNENKCKRWKYIYKVEICVRKKLFYLFIHQKENLSFMHGIVFSFDSVVNEIVKLLWSKVQSYIYVFIPYSAYTYYTMRLAFRQGFMLYISTKQNNYNGFYYNWTIKNNHKQTKKKKYFVKYYCSLYYSWINSDWK